MTREEKNTYANKYYHKKVSSKAKGKEKYVTGLNDKDKKLHRKKQMKAYLIEYRKDPIFKLKHSYRTALLRGFKNNGLNKTCTSKVLGCSFNELKFHLESLFVKGMSWDNHGKWHIDHIIPLNKANTVKEVEQLNYYTNLQPLWAKDNLIKGSKINLKL